MDRGWGLVYHIPAERVHIFHGDTGPVASTGADRWFQEQTPIPEVDLGASGRVVFRYVANVTAYHLTDEGST